MRLGPQLCILTLVAPLAACGKSPPPPTASSDPPTIAADKPTEPAPPPAPAKPPTKTGVLDLELQEVNGGYELITPRITQHFTSKPQVQRQDTPTPFGDMIESAFAMDASGYRADGLLYMPIPKGIQYDVKKALKGARDGMLDNMFEAPYAAKDEPAKLGPLDANHVIVNGKLKQGGQSVHLEAWLAFDEVDRTLYSLMSMRLPDDLGDVAAVHDGFRLRPSAALIDDVKHAR